MNLPYQMLLDISTGIEIFVPILIFFLLAEPRYAKRPYWCCVTVFCVLYMGWNLALLVRFGLEVVGRYFLLTQTLPSVIFSFIVSKHRNGRFFFTFCLVDTVCLWVITFTGIVDYFAGNTGLVTFILRIILFPLMVVFVWRLARRPYRRLLDSVSRGLGIFAAMTALFYITITILAAIPTNLRSRPQDIPATLAVLALLPLVYLTVFWLIVQQKELFEARERQRQMAALRQDYNVLQKKLELGRSYRHDMRHHMTALTALLQENDSRGALDYLTALQGQLTQMETESWCENAAVNGVLSAYLAQARDAGCALTVAACVPKQLPFEEVDLCIVLANALENAIHACEAAPDGAPREIRLELSITSGRRLTLLLENACQTAVSFDRDGFPVVPHREGHGQGLRSIAAVAEKYHGLFRCDWAEGKFSLRVVLLDADVREAKEC